MADKDITEREIIAEKLPGTALLICLFHTLRSFQREITSDKLGISQAERNLSLELLQKMAYSQTVQDYEIHVDQLRHSAPRAVIEYFERNWHPIRCQWVQGLKNNHCHYMNTTNNRLESINQKLKAVINRYSPMTTFLIKCVWSLKIEREHRALDVTVKRPIINFDDQDLSQYATTLTPFAFQYVKKQFHLIDKVN